MTRAGALNRWWHSRCDCGGLGAEVLVCAPPDCAERLAEVGVPLVPAGEPVRDAMRWWPVA
jgi:hypothetical protein